MEVVNIIEKANILVMGNSGAGKSTLINSIFHGNAAEVGAGNSVTQIMKIYEDENVDFRAIDTKGLEYGMFNQMKTKHDIKKWSKDSVTKNDKDRYIHVIWYCIDATSKRVFEKNLDSIKSVSKMWKNVPIIIVLTKSYSETETAGNIEMVKNCIAKYKDNKYLNIDGIIPVIAHQFPINDEMIITPVGVDDLVEKTNAILPEAFKINEDAVFKFKIRIKRANANILTVGVTSASMVVEAIPVPFADSIILTPLQGGLIVGIMKIYGIKNEGDVYKEISGAIISGGVVTIAAKTIISSLKAIPGLNIAAAIINAVVAGIITAVMGEITITISEKIANGEIKSSDLDWMKKFAESEFLKKSGRYIEQIKKMLKTKDLKKIGKMITATFKGSSK